LIGINNTPFNACDIVATWLDDAMADIGWRELMRNDDRTIGKLVAGYEMHGLLISISAWTQGNCLDVDVLDIQSNAVHPALRRSLRARGRGTGSSRPPAAANQERLSPLKKLLSVGRQTILTTC